MINRNHERAENVVKIKILTVDLDLNTFFKTFFKCTITNHMTKINKRKEKLPKTYLFYAFLIFFLFLSFLSCLSVAEIWFSFFFMIHYSPSTIRTSPFFADCWTCAMKRHRMMNYRPKNNHNSSIDWLLHWYRYRLWLEPVDLNLDQ